MIKFSTSASGLYGPRGGNSLRDLRAGPPNPNIDAKYWKTQEMARNATIGNLTGKMIRLSALKKNWRSYWFGYWICRIITNIVTSWGSLLVPPLGFSDCLEGGNHWSFLVPIVWNQNDDLVEIYNPFKLPDHQANCFDEILENADLTWLCSPIGLCRTGGSLSWLDWGKLSCSLAVLSRSQPLLSNRARQIWMSSMPVMSWNWTRTSTCSGDRCRLSLPY